MDCIGTVLCCCVCQGVATLPAGVNVASTLTAGAGATPKVGAAASSVTALRVVTPGGATATQPAALRVTPVSSGVRSAGTRLCCCCCLPIIIIIIISSSSSIVVLIITKKQ